MVQTSMTSVEKMELFKSITVQDILDWLDGAVLMYKMTEKNMDSIDGRYCGKESHCTRFDKSKYNMVYLSNGRMMSSEKSFIDEFIRIRNEYWDLPSKNIMKKVCSKHEAIKLLFKKYKGYMHFKIASRRWDYINIECIISKKQNYAIHDHHDEIVQLDRSIYEMEQTINKLKSKRSKMKQSQQMHDVLYESKSE